MYHILHENGDPEDFYHNEVKDFHVDTVKRHPNNKRWKKRTKKAAIQLIQKFAPTEMEVEEHVMFLSIEDIRAIASNGSTNAVPQLYVVDFTWSYCVELPVQRLFLRITVDLGLSMFRKFHLCGSYQKEWYMSYIIDIIVNV